MRVARSSAISTAMVALLTAATAVHAQDVTLTIESWRTDDLVIWQDKIIPAFEAGHPGIKLEFVGTAPTEYVAAIDAKLQAGSAGDIITCRPFDTSLALYDKGYLASLNDLPGIENFSPVARSAWSTDDAAETFCVPMASVIHGFIYNKDAFAEVGIDVPRTMPEFYAALDAIKADGRYIPLAMGTIDQWESTSMGYQNIGPNYWKGEEGRLGLLYGTEKLTDEGWVAPFRELGKWGAYLGDGFQSQTYPDSQNIFTLGRAAIYPSGSWEISGFEANAAFELGAFAPPVPTQGDACFISDHNDIGIGMNAATTNPEAARTFLTWVASAEFADLYANALPGFFSLNSAPVQMQDPLAQEFVSWREDCHSTIRPTYQVLSRGTPSLENEMWTATANVVNGTETPEAAAKRLQDGLDSWFKPLQN